MVVLVSSNGEGKPKQFRGSGWELIMHVGSYRKGLSRWWG